MSNRSFKKYKFHISCLKFLPANLKLFETINVKLSDVRLVAERAHTSLNIRRKLSSGTDHKVKLKRAILDLTHEEAVSSYVGTKVL